MSDSDLPDIGTVATATVDGLSIRYARSGAPGRTPVVLTSPWPESLYSFRHLTPLLARDHPVIAVDLPGFGLSESRPDVMAPEAMGDFVIALLTHFGIGEAHVVAPDVGTPAVLFAAAKRDDLFRSLVVGGAAARTDLAGGRLADLIHSPAGSFAAIDGAIAMKDYLSAAAKLTPAPVIEDFRKAAAGARFESQVQFVRGYIADLPKLERLLPGIATRALIIAGKNDAIVPPANGQFLGDRLHNREYVLLDAGHRIWEEAPDAYARHVLNWISGRQ